MLLHGIDRGHDVVRLVADDLHRPPFGQVGFHQAELLLEPLDDLHGIRSRLLADVHDHRGLAVDRRDRFRLGHAVFDMGDVADLDHIAVRGRERDVGEISGRLHASVRAQCEIAQALLHLAPGDLHVLRLEGGHELCRGHADRGELGRVDHDVDLARTSADDEGLADPVDRLDPPAKLLVGELGDVPNRRRAGKGDAEDRNGVGIDLQNDRRIGVLGQIAQDGVDLVAHFLRGHVDILLQNEADDDLRGPLGRDRL